MSTPVNTRAVILGNDTLLAAQPATFVQLALACARAGYAFAVPSSWGDELVAAECVKRCATHPSHTLVHTSCPKIRDRLLERGTELSSYFLTSEAPPVAAARYLRALSPEPLRIEFVGECSGGSHPEIDTHYSPDDFLARLRSLGADPRKMPKAFDSVFPPDRSRFWSLPGGFPSPEMLWEHGGERAHAEVDPGRDFADALAEELLSGERLLIDLTSGLECACSGALTGVPILESRARLAAGEPPRSSMPVIDHEVYVVLSIADVDAVHEPPNEAGSRKTLSGLALMDDRVTVVRPAGSHPVITPNSPVPVIIPVSPRADSPPVRVDTTDWESRPRTSGPRKRPTPTGVTRMSPTSVPVARQNDGKLVPRAYAAKRRSTPSKGSQPPDGDPDGGTTRGKKRRD